MRGCALQKARSPGSSFEDFWKKILKIFLEEFFEKILRKILEMNFMIYVGSNTR